MAAMHRVTLGVLLLAALAVSVQALSMPALRAATLEASAASDAVSAAHPLHSLGARFIPLHQKSRTEQEESDYFDRLEEHHDMLHEGQPRHIALQQLTSR
jgi:hypothetical protein